MPYFGASGSGETSYLWASTTSAAYNIETVQTQGVGTILMFDQTGTQIGTRTAGGTQTMPSGVKGIKLKANGGDIHAVRVTTSNPNSKTINFDTPKEDSGGGSGGGGGSEGGCFCGCFFDSDDWRKHTGKLDSIRSAITSSSTAQVNKMEEVRQQVSKVSGEFVKGMDNLLGRAPSAPSKPDDIKLDKIKAPAEVKLKTPDAPAVMPLPPKPSVEEPKMQENKELKEAGFTQKDIKDQAPEIKFEEAPEETFIINNPVDSLPEIEEFPDYGQKSPLDQGHKEYEYEQPELNNDPPIPSEPKEPEYELPIPAEPEQSMPIPSEPDQSFPIPAEPDQSVGTGPIPNTNMDVPIPSGGGGSSNPFDYMGSPE